MKAASPKRIDVDKEELLELIDQSSTRPLTVEERGKLRAGVETLDYVTDQVRMRNQRLYRLLFGPSSEKTSEVFGQQEKQPEAPAGASSDDAPGSTGDDDDKKKKRKGHGRRPATAYRGAQRTCVPHESLRPGQTCPACGKGKLYQQAPAVLVRLRGRAPLDATVFECDRLRCNLCLEIFTAPAPPEAGEQKYDETAAAMIALLRYGSGMPHHRLERLQQSLGIPLPASTQWRVVDRAAQSIEPVYDELVREAAQGEVVHNDDTKMPVLSLTGKRRAKEAGRSPRHRSRFRAVGGGAQRRRRCHRTGRHGGHPLQ